MEPVNDVLSNNDVLKGIAVHVFYGKYSAFLQTYADAYLLADNENALAMRPTWMYFIDKYLVKNHGVIQKEVEGGV